MAVVESKSEREKCLANVDQIAELIAAGLPAQLACAKAGVNYAVFRRMAKLDDVQQRLDGAQAKFLAEAVQKISRCERNWQGAAWILERRYPHLFAKSPEVEVTTNIQNNSISITAEDLKLIQDAAQRNLARLAKITRQELPGLGCSKGQNEITQ